MFAWRGLVAQRRANVNANAQMRDRFGALREFALKLDL